MMINNLVEQFLFALKPVFERTCFKYKKHKAKIIIISPFIDCKKQAKIICFCIEITTVASSQSLRTLNSNLIIKRRAKWLAYLGSNATQADTVFYLLPNTITKTLPMKSFTLPASRCTSTYSTAFPSPTAGLIRSHRLKLRSQFQASDPTVRFVISLTYKLPTTKARRQPTTQIGRRFQSGSHAATSFAKNAFAIWHGMPTPAAGFSAPSVEPASTTCQSQRRRVGKCSSSACGSRSRFSSGCTATRRRTTSRIWRPSSDGRRTFLACRVMCPPQTSGKRLNTLSNPGSIWEMRTFAEIWPSPFWGRGSRSHLRLCGSVELVVVLVEQDGHPRMEAPLYSFTQGACECQDHKTFMLLIDIGGSTSVCIYQGYWEETSVLQTPYVFFFFSTNEVSCFFFPFPFKNSEGRVG